MSANDSDLLLKFQRQGDVEALISYGQNRGYSDARLRAVLVSIQTILEALSLGLQPDYDNVDRKRLLELQPETILVVHAMYESEAADLKTAGLHLMGVLNLEPFLQDLQDAVASAHDWERIEAIGALTRMTHPQARTILESLSQHPDAVTRQAASKALAEVDAKPKP